MGRRGPARHPIDLTGRRIGRLVVVERIGSPWDLRGRACGFWRCRCDCGTVRVIRGDALTSKRPTQSCGCLRREAANEGVGRWVAAGRPGAFVRHGHTTGGPSKTYNSWMAMRQRCLNPKSSKYHRYGARGITVCDRWATSFDAFLADMGERPEHTTLDRIDPSGNYEPSNCRWATPYNQWLNRRLQAGLSARG